ncbi:hypothetical protein [Gordonia sp. N1V]|uniref:hypothetical protein n=1 Tax=Gordonia sp. N1V TaxID=3034163 RepID=UPI0023E2E336|nr:hypothetical protein [Gordonia sp. N1V]MDF3281117.1 hypothetical protein [Gordonia sp. N1V]
MLSSTSAALRVDMAEAERPMRDNDEDFLSALRPGFEKIAHNIAELTRDAEDLDIHFAGGALMYPGGNRPGCTMTASPKRTGPHDADATDPQLIRRVRELHALLS